MFIYVQNILIYSCLTDFFLLLMMGRYPLSLIYTLQEHYIYSKVFVYCKMQNRKSTRVLSSFSITMTLAITAIFVK